MANGMAMRTAENGGSEQRRSTTFAFADRESPTFHTFVLASPTFHAFSLSLFPLPTACTASRVIHGDLHWLFPSPCAIPVLRVGKETPVSSRTASQIAFHSSCRYPDQSLTPPLLPCTRCPISKRSSQTRSDGGIRCGSCHPDHARVESRQGAGSGAAAFTWGESRIERES